MDRDMCNSLAHYVGMCGQAFTNPQGNVQVTTTTGLKGCAGKHQHKDRTREEKSTGTITGNCWKLCKYSGTVEGSLVRENTQVSEGQGFVRISPQSRNVDCMNQILNLTFTYFPLLKDRVWGSKVLDFWMHQK